MSFNSKYKNSDDILEVSFMVRAPSLLRFAEEDFDTIGSPIDVRDNELVKTDLSFMDTFGMKLREIVVAAADGYRIYLLRPNDSQKMFDLLEEYLIRTMHNFEMNRSELDTTFRMHVKEFADNMVTVNNRRMHKNTAVDKMTKLFPSKTLVDTYLSTPKDKRKKSTVYY